MGLDMYLSKRKKLSRDTYSRDEEIMYWRKANQIFKFFEDNLELEDGYIEDCEYYKVSKQLMKKLFDKIEIVLNSRDEETSKELLPTQSGFFFGGTEYDEWYYKDLENTLAEKDRILKEFDNLKYGENIYLFNWW